MAERLAVTMLLGSVLLPALMSAAVRGQDSVTRRSSLALVGATIYVSPTEEPIHDGVVLIESGRITSVGTRSSLTLPASMQSIDCTGLTITAGFWNSHVHFFERKWADVANIPGPELNRQLQDMLTRYGFTSVFDLSSPWQNTRRLRERIESGEVAGPSIRSTGEALLPPGALPSQTVLSILGLMSFPAPEIRDATEAAAASRTLLNHGVDGIKLFAQAGSPIVPLSERTIRAVTDEAHRVRKPVFAHPTSAAGLLTAVRGGVDVIAHTTPQSGPWNDSLVAAMKERRVALIPTLRVWKYNTRHDRASVQDQVGNAAVAQLRTWLASGGTVLFGTDVGYVDYHPGEEYALMSEAGMDFRGILASLTTAPAERFGQSAQLGRVAPGLQADLVVLEGDPARDIRALADVRYTLRAGQIIYRSNQ